MADDPRVGGQVPDRQLGEWERVAKFTGAPCGAGGVLALIADLRATRAALTALRAAFTGPVGMRPDGTADPRVEAGADALSALGVSSQKAWDYAHAVLEAALTGSSAGVIGAPPAAADPLRALLADEDLMLDLLARAICDRLPGLYGRYNHAALGVLAALREVADQ